MSLKLHLISLGCTKNLVDSEVMLGCLGEYEVSQNLAESDVIIINTCGFIQSAKQESIKTILNAAESKRKDSILVVSGCLSERYAKELEEQMPEIDILIGVRDYDKIDSFLRQKQDEKQAIKVTSTPLHKDSLKRNFSTQDKIFLATQNHKRIIANSTTHAYIKLSEGCNQQCSFCSIPSFKGKLQSKSIDSILQEVEILSVQGFIDFSFIAQDSSSYLKDFGINDGLIALIKALDSSKLIKNARIHYLYPTSTSFKLIDTIAESSVVQNYFDIPIQHIADSMLKRMRRGMNEKDLLALLNHIKQVPNAFLRSSIIIGHPGESDEEFSRLVDFINEGIFDRLNIFAFSSEEGTLADSMPNKIPTKIINSRINAINKILKSQDKARYKQMIGQTYEVIVESKSQISEFFYSARDVRWGVEVDGEILINDIELDSSDAKSYIKNGFYTAKITDYKQGFLFGKIIE